MVEIGSFSSRGHAEMAAGMLEAHGIRATVRGDDAGGAAPHVAVGAHGYRLAVDDPDAEAAEELLAGDVDVDSSEPASSARLGVLNRPGMLRWLVAVLVVVVVAGVLLGSAL